MGFPIKIQSIIAELEIQFDEVRTFLDSNTGALVSVNEEDLMAAEDEEPFDHLSDWEQEARRLASDVVENLDDYIELPTSNDLNEYTIMEDFCLSVDDHGIQKKLLGAIKGQGAFRRFKDKVREYGIEENWYSFREERFREIAIDWCKDNGINFVE